MRVTVSSHSHVSCGDMERGAGVTVQQGIQPHSGGLGGVRGTRDMSTLHDKTHGRNE